MSHPSARDPVPAPEDLASAPELAALSVLQRALEVARSALLAAYPELHACPDEITGELPWDAQADCAVALVSLADDLLVALVRYRRLLAQAHAVLRAGADIPF